jgi:hypothetical protein
MPLQIIYKRMAVAGVNGRFMHSANSELNTRKWRKDETMVIILSI